MSKSHKAFSLIELVITLAILAAAATIAIRATSNLQTAARYQQTVRSLNDIQAAIIGPSNQRNPDGSTLVTGFVADTGRLPEFYISANDPLGTTLGDPLNELVSNPNNLPAYAAYASNVDPTVIVGAGWQGPYIHLGAGPTYIRDGWGNSLHAYSFNSASNSPWAIASTQGTQIAGIASWGADNAADVNHLGSVAIAGNYNDDVSLPSSTFTNPTGTSTSGFQFPASATVVGQVTMDVGVDTSPATSGPTPNPTTGGYTKSVSLWIDYIGPDMTQSPNPVGDDPVLIATTTGSGSTTAWPVGFSGQFAIPTVPVSPNVTPVTIGPRVLKAYVLPQTVTTVAQFKTWIETTTNTPYATATLNVTLVPGTQTINLVLPHYTP